MWISRYWIKLKSLCQDASYRKLALAIVLSLLLHLLLMGEFSLNLANLNEQQDLIEARLVLPKAVPTSIANPSPVSRSVENQVKHKVTTDFNQDKPDEITPVGELTPPTESMPVDDVNLTETSEANQDYVEGQSEFTDSSAKPEPYQYVATEYDVYTVSDVVTNRSVAGSAKVVYQRLPSGEEYKLSSLIKAGGVYALVIPDLLQISEGFITNNGLQPVHFLYQFGNKRNKTFNADFNWENKKLVLKSEKGVETLDLPTGTQDLLSFMYQFMFVPPMQNLQLNITNGKKLGSYDYAFEGEEIISTKMGNLKTFHLSRSAEIGEKKTELWLALDYQHVPVKIRETNKDGQVYELLVTSLKTELPVTSQE